MRYRLAVALTRPIHQPIRFNQGRGQVRAAGPRDGAQPDHPPAGGGSDGEARQTGRLRGYVIRDAYIFSYV